MTWFCHWSPSRLWCVFLSALQMQHKKEDFWQEQLTGPQMCPAGLCSLNWAMTVFPDPTPLAFRPAAHSGLFGPDPAFPLPSHSWQHEMRATLGPVPSLPWGMGQRESRNTRVFLSDPAISTLRPHLSEKDRQKAGVPHTNKTIGQTDSRDTPKVSKSSLRQQPNYTRDLKIKSTFNLIFCTSPRPRMHLQTTGRPTDRRAGPSNSILREADKAKSRRVLRNPQLWNRMGLSGHRFWKGN